MMIRLFNVQRMFANMNIYLFTKVHEFRNVKARRQNMLPDWWPVTCVSGKLRRRESTKPRGVTRADLNFFHDRTDLDTEMPFLKQIT